MQPRPVYLERRIVPKPWGGQNLKRVVGIDLPAVSGDEDELASVGETWELYDRPDGASGLRDFPGVTVADLRADKPVAWMGRRYEFAEHWPILVKFLDAADQLSVQVHPGDEMAREFGDCGKNEAWVVLDVREDARIVCGLEPGHGVDELGAAIQAAQNGDTHSMEAMLNAFRPEPDEVLLVEAGTVHAIGPGVVAFEVQQNSDVTFRLYDWGRPRELHVDEALRAFSAERTREAATVTPGPIERGGRQQLLRHRDFAVDRFSDLSAPEALLTGGVFRVLNVLDGRGTLGWRSGGDDLPLMLQAGDTILVPASLEQVYLSPVGKLDVLWTGPGGGRDE